MDEEMEIQSRAPAAKGFQVTSKEKAEWVKRFNESGLSLRTFSAKHGLGYMSLWRWGTKSRELSLATPPLPFFTEIKLPTTPHPTHWSVELSFANGNVLRFCGEVPPAVLEQLLRVC